MLKGGDTLNNRINPISEKNLLQEICVASGIGGRLPYRVFARQLANRRRRKSARNAIKKSRAVVKP